MFSFTFPNGDGTSNEYQIMEPPSLDDIEAQIRFSIWYAHDAGDSDDAIRNQLRWAVVYGMAYQKEHGA